MRLGTLLLVIVAILLLTAPAASFAQSSAALVSSAKAGSSFTGDSGAVIRPDGTPASPENASEWRKLNSGSQLSCFTMRTYVVARDTPDSDSTHAAGYHECVPAWKFEMRSSEQREPAAGTTAGK